MYPKIYSSGNSLVPIPAPVSIGKKLRIANKDRCFMLGSSPVSTFPNLYTQIWKRVAAVVAPLAFTGDSVEAEGKATEI
jgi:hypothetical protein